MAYGNKTVAARMRRQEQTGTRQISVWERRHCYEYQRGERRNCPFGGNIS